MSHACPVIPSGHEALLADGRGYIPGGSFSVADVYLGSGIAWGRQFCTLPERPSFAAHAERITSRAAAARARDLDDALMPRDA